MPHARTHSRDEARGARPRRAPGEIRRLLIDAAREVFEERGYARATTREITRRAGVAETLLFRTFGSKANLFTQAVLRPLADLFHEWVQHVAQIPPTVDVADTSYEFNESLYEMAAANRGLLLTFFSTAVFEPEVLAANDAIATISESLDDLAAASESGLHRLHVDLDGYDVLVSSRIVVGTILAMALFGGVLLPSGERARDRDQVLRELTRQILFGGLNLRPPGNGQLSRRPRGARTARSSRTSASPHR
jgi:AcrR family transcriptional regulator